MGRFPWVIVLLALLVVGGPLHAQGPAACPGDLGTREPTPIRLAGPEVERSRILALGRVVSEAPLLGTRRIHHGSPGPGCGARGLFVLTPVSVRTAANTGWARSRSDEGSWGARGLALDLRGGLHGGWGPLEYALVPSLHLEGNRSFRIPEGPGVSEFQYPWHDSEIDWALRPGAGTDLRVLPGQSHFSLVAGPLRAGVSTQSLRWGPALRNPILLSGTAPGFPHLYLQTRRPVGTPVGGFDLELIVGRPSQSEPLERLVADLPRRGFAGVLLGYRPPFARGLNLGVGVVNHVNLTDDLGLFEQFREVLDLFRSPFAEELEDNLPGNALAALYIRWHAPESGTEVYFEVARNDHAADFADALGEPDHAFGFTAGFQKLLDRGGDRVRILGEVTDLRGRTLLGPRNTATFFRHSRAREGHTHKGQLLGAPIGPGAMAVHMGADLLSPDHGLVGLYVERVEYDADAHRTRFAAIHGPRGRDREWTLGARHHRVLNAWGPLQGLELAAEGAYSRRVNRLFLGFVTGDGLELPIDGNWHLDLRVTWQPPPLFAR